MFKKVTFAVVVLCALSCAAQAQEWYLYEGFDTPYITTGWGRGGTVTLEEFDSKDCIKWDLPADANVWAGFSQRGSYGQDMSGYESMKMDVYLTSTDSDGVVIAMEPYKLNGTDWAGTSIEGIWQTITPGEYGTWVTVTLTFDPTKNADYETISRFLYKTDGMEADADVLVYISNIRLVPAGGGTEVTINACKGENFMWLPADDGFPSPVYLEEPITINNAGDGAGSMEIHWSNNIGSTFCRPFPSLPAANQGDFEEVTQVRFMVYTDNIAVTFRPFWWDGDAFAGWGPGTQTASAVDTWETLTFDVSELAASGADEADLEEFQMAAGLPSGSGTYFIDKVELFGTTNVLDWNLY